MLEIDGSIGEGGGQILRTSLTLSCVKGAPFRMVNIRAGRDKPGLRPQHLMSVSAARQICDATVTGDKVGSMEITFEPRKTRGGPYLFEVGTAGSVALVLHTIFLPLALSGEESRVKIEGGTHVEWSPPFEHLDICWERAINAMGIHIALDLQRAGYYPKGGGRIDAKIAPTASVNPINWTKRGPLRRLTIRGAVSNLPDEIASRMISRARRFAHEIGIKNKFIVEDIHRPPCVTEGAYFFILAEFDSVDGVETPPAGFVSLGRRGKRAEILVDEAWAEFLDFFKTDAPIDRRLADQLLLPFSMAAGPSEFSTSSVTDHLITNAGVIEHFGAAKIEIQGSPGSPGLVRVRPCSIPA